LSGKTCKPTAAPMLATTASPTPQNTNRFRSWRADRVSTTSMIATTNAASIPSRNMITNDSNMIGSP